MVKTLEELAKGQSYILTDKFEDDYHTVVSLEDVIKLMKLVRTQTLIEAANKSDADINILHNLQNYNVNLEGIKVYVLKKSILQLDKNSIEL